MSSELVRRTAQVPAPSTLDEAVSLGRIYAASGFFQDSRDEAQAVVKILAGQTMGLSPFASMTGLYLVKGRLGVSANILASMVRASERYDYRIVELTDERCEIAYVERTGQRWDEIGRSTFTKADATRAQTANMGAFPRNMLFARAMSNGVRWFCPDVTSGPTYTPEELGAAVDEQGQVIEGQFVEQTPAVAVTTNGNGHAPTERTRSQAFEDLQATPGWGKPTKDWKVVKERMGYLLTREIANLKDLSVADIDNAATECAARHAARSRYYAIAGCLEDPDADRARIYAYLGITPAGVRRTLSAEQWATAADAADLELHGSQEPLTTDLDAEDEADPFEAQVA